ncbi:Dot/Icm T4SS effector kinase LegK1 [Legionella norrlandica]|nr:Dot/Icm T4SS effector kinase LegK1 [Legionella norrlandica]
MFFRIDAANIRALHANNSHAFEALRCYLNDTSSLGVWNKNQEYQYNYKNINYRFCFTHSLVRQPRKSDKEKYKFEVFDPEQKPVGKGGYGIVYPIIGSIRLEADPAIKKNKKNKLVKIQSHTELDRSYAVVQEYKGLLQAGHIAVKPPVFITDKRNKLSYLIMEKVDGIVLEEVLNPVKRLNLLEEIPEFNFFHRIELTFAILKAIQEQITNKHLIHRDIKPDNIIVDLNKSPPVAKVIDFGFVLREPEQDYRRCGTRAYRAPETFIVKPTYSTKADVWSTGRLLSYLWGDEYSNYYISRDKTVDFVIKKSSNELLFSYPELELYLTEEDKNKIRVCLRKMLLVDPDERGTIDEAIEQFSQINFEKYKKLTQSALNENDIRLRRQLNSIHLHLISLQGKEKELRQKSCFEAADAMNRLVNKLSNYTNYLEKNPSLFLIKRYKDCCTREIDLANSTLRNHRNTLWLIAELSTAIALLGVGYLVALGINYCATGRLGLFSQTKSEKLLDEVTNSILVMG